MNIILESVLNHRECAGLLEESESENKYKIYYNMRWLSYLNSLNKELEGKHKPTKRISLLNECLRTSRHSKLSLHYRKFH